MHDGEIFWDWAKFESNLTPQDRARISSLETALHEIWDLGHNVIVCWAPVSSGIELVAVRYYAITDILAETDAKGSPNPRAVEMRRIIEGPVKGSEGSVRAFAANMGMTTQRLDLSFTPGREIGLDLIDDLIRRYAITLDRDRAVALFDIVGFSLRSPLEQVTQLNSLARSLNLAQGYLAERRYDIEFARSTTGDGYYVWNRNGTPQANLNLYHLMHLALAHNAVGLPKAHSASTPVVRACFHVGSFYEFFQPEGLCPTVYDYIVGDATIEIARLIGQAAPGQILVGDFRLAAPDSNIVFDTVQFIERTRETAATFEGLVLAGETIESIKCYLTGRQRPDGTFGVKQYFVTDKHGVKHVAYNAKINLHLKNADPIFLGLQDSEVEGLEIAGEITGERFEVDAPSAVHP